MLLGEIEMKSPSEECCYTSFQRNDKMEEEITTLDYRQCCITCCKLLLILGWLSYYVVGIISLTTTSYREEREICPMSDLWLYLSFSLIANTALIKVNNRNNHPNIYYLLQPNLTVIIIKILFIVWLSLEMKYSMCLSELRDTNLYYMSMTQYGLDILIVIYLVGLTFYLIKHQGNQDKKNKDDAIRKIRESFDDINDEEKELIS